MSLTLFKSKWHKIALNFMDKRILAFMAELVRKNPARKYQNHYSHGKGYVGTGRNNPPMETTKLCDHGISPSKPEPKRRR
jgi:hypothetical protein